MWPLGWFAELRSLGVSDRVVQCAEHMIVSLKVAPEDDSGERYSAHDRRCRRDYDGKA